MREAERVILLAIGEAAADSVEAGAAMLRRHGATVEPQQIEGRKAMPARSCSRTGARAVTSVSTGSRPTV